jgi:5'-3' exonuclease
MSFSKKGLIDGEVLAHWSLWKTHSVEEFQKNVEYNIRDWTETCMADDYLIALGGKNNFRLEIFKGYKQTPSRIKSRKEPLAHQKDSFEWLASHAKSVIGEGMEADDVLAMKQNDSSVIITVDKDLLQVAGHHFNPKKGIAGNQHVTPKEAFVNLQRQLIQGDPIDNIPGIPKFGPVKTAALIDKGADPIDVYKSYYKDEWKKYFEFNGKLLFLLRNLEDAFTVERYEELRLNANYRTLEIQDTKS